MKTLLFLCLSALSLNGNSQCNCDPLPIIGNQVVINSSQGTSAIQTAINNASGPLTILLQDGTYSVASGQINITKPNITIRSQSGIRENVIIEGNGMLNGSYHGISILHRKATIADLTIKNINNHGIDINFWYQSGPIDSTLIHNVHVIDCGQQLIKMSYSGTSSQRGDNGIIECCLIEYTNSLPGSNLYTNGIDLHNAHNWIIRDNVIKNIQAGPSTTSDAGPAILFFKGGSNAIIERNSILNCDEGIFLGNWGDSPNMSHNGGIIRNNIIRGHSESRCGIGVVLSPNILILNNTIYSPGGTAWTAQEYSIEITGNLCTNILIQNNAADEAYFNNQNLAPTPTLITNNFACSNSFFVDVNLNSLDLQPANGSGLINSGTSHVEANADFNCLSRIGIPDQGAYEIQVPNEISENRTELLSLYPNPSSQLIYLNFDEQLFDQNLVIYNSSGQLIQELNINVSLARLDISNYANGIYFIRTGNQFLKFIKE